MRANLRPAANGPPRGTRPLRGTSQHPPTNLRTRPRMVFTPPPETIMAFNFNIEKSENRQLMFSIRGTSDMDGNIIRVGAFIAARMAIEGASGGSENLDWDAVQLSQTTSKAGAVWWIISITGNQTQITAVRAFTETNTAGHLFVPMNGKRLWMSPCPNRVPTDPMYLIRINSNPEEVFTPASVQTMLPRLADQFHEEQMKVEWVIQLGDRDDADSGTDNLICPGSLRQWLNPAEAKPGRCFALVHGGHKLVREASETGFAVAGLSKEVRGWVHNTSLRVHTDAPLPLLVPGTTGSPDPTGGMEPAAGPPAPPHAPTYAGSTSSAASTVNAMAAEARAAVNATLGGLYRGPYPPPPPFPPPPPPPAGGRVPVAPVEPQQLATLPLPPPPPPPPPGAEETPGQARATQQPAPRPEEVAGMRDRQAARMAALYREITPAEEGEGMGRDGAKGREREGGQGAPERVIPLRSMRSFCRSAW